MKRCSRSVFGIPGKVGTSGRLQQAVEVTTVVRLAVQIAASDSRAAGPATVSQGTTSATAVTAARPIRRRSGKRRAVDSIRSVALRMSSTSTPAGSVSAKATAFSNKSRRASSWPSGSITASTNAWRSGSNSMGSHFDAFRRRLAISTVHSSVWRSSRALRAGSIQRERRQGDDSRDL